RKPDRLGVVALVGLCLLAGAAVAEIARRVARVRPAPAALLVLFVAAPHVQYARGDGTPDALPGRAVPAAYPLQPALPPGAAPVGRPGRGGAFPRAGAAGAAPGAAGGRRPPSTAAPARSRR